MALPLLSWFREAMSNEPLFECDLVRPGESRAFATVRLPAVPRVGELIDLGPSPRGEGVGTAGSYRVLDVLYHVAPRRRLGGDAGPLVGISLLVAVDVGRLPAAAES